MRKLKITKSITNREDISIQKYLKEIGKYDLITSEQEVELAQQIREGSQSAKDKLVKANLRFVVSVAKQFQNNGLSLPDLINSGNLGLVKSAGLFDETRGFKFISYAVWWIRQSIMQALNEQSRLVRLPLNQDGELRKYNRAIDSFKGKNDREPNDFELQVLFDIDVKKLKPAYNAALKHSSFDSFLGHEADNTLLDVFVSDDIRPTDEPVMQQSNRQTLLRFLNRLPDRQQYIIKNMYGFSGPAKRLDELAEELNLTKERVRQIGLIGIKKLKTFKPQLKQQLN